MFERFTDRSRRVVVLAQEEARMLGHGHIGTEHLLLGLLHEQSGVPAQVLGSAGIMLEAARAQVEEIAGPGSKTPSGHIPFTPRAKRILELALREALELKQSYIGTEHLLLGLIREQHGVGAQVLERLGGPLPALRQRVIAAVWEVPPDPVAEEEGIPEAGALRWPPFAQGFARAVRVQTQTIGEFRELLTSIDQRLSNIERYLGLAGGQEAESDRSSQEPSDQESSGEGPQASAE